MKTIEEFLSYLCSLDIKIVVEGDRLRCNAPEGKLTQDLQVELKARKAEILKFMQQGHLAAKTVELIKPVPRDGNLPLSFAQQRLWLLSQLEYPSATYNIPLALRLSGPLQVAALEQAIAEIVRRHEVLRTTFKMVNGSPVQVINPVSSMTLAVVDLQHLEQGNQSALVQQLITEEAQHPFDLSKDTLLRVNLLRLQQSEYVLLLVMHHIVSDGWSLGIFIRELSALYQAFCFKQPSPLSELPIQYADFAYWQRQWLSGEVMETQLNYWQQQLAGAPPLLELPTDRPRPPQQTFRGSTVEFKLSSELTQKLVALRQKSGTTLFMTLLAAFVTLLGRYSNQPDIVVGSPIANRNCREIEPLIGFFVNTLMLRIDLKGNPRFSQLLNQVRLVTLNAYTHQDLPFEQLVEALQPERNLSYNPLFQVMFVLQNAPMDKLELAGLTLKPLEVENATAKFDLTLSMSETEEGLIGCWEYNSDLFEVATIKRMVGHFQTLLESIVAYPEQRVRELPLLTEAEQQQLLVEWNNTKADYTEHLCVHQLFEEQVERTPKSIAVVYEQEQLSYGELNARANKVARQLQQLGVERETIVGLYVERSLLTSIGLLGILKAGGAYLPLDPQLPSERLNMMLQDAGVEVILTQQHLASCVSEQVASVVCLDRDWEAIAIQSEENLPSTTTVENLVYVIYTSGSTGTPKGVSIEHRQLLNYVYSIVEKLDLTPGCSFATVSILAADLGNTMIFPSLLTGGCLHVISQERVTNPQAWGDYCTYHGIDCLKIVPSHLNVLLSAAQPEKILPQRRLILGGEACSWQLVAKIQHYAPKCKIFNHYGPTETTVGVLTYQVEDSEVGVNSQTVPLGRPLANTQIYLLDSHQQPVAVGVPGELCIAGLGLARGYLQKPQQTTAKFIPNPLSSSEGARLYRTGDLARYLPDGNIEYLGRIDNQIKLRGFRIELGEIEAALSQHPEVRETIVIAREDQPGNKHLVAYIVPNSENLAVSVLRDFLQKKLPNYMIPAAFVLLNALPLTPNGKVNRKALPPANTSSSSLESSFVPPRNTLELQLAQIWSEVLDVHPAGVRDNFFDLGGHSLLAVRVMAKIQQQFGRNLPLATLFQSCTIEKLASILRSSITSQFSSPLIAIQSAGNRTPFFCIHPVGGNVLCYGDLARHLGFEQPVYGLQSSALNRDFKPLTRIEDIAAYYIQEVQTIQPQSPYYLGGWSLGGVIAFEMAQQLHSCGHEVALLALIDSYAPIANKHEEIDEAMLTALLAKDFCGLFGKELLVSVDELRQLRLQEQLNYILEQAKMLNILPPEVGLQQMQQLLQVFKVNLNAMSRYTPQPYPGQVTLFCASEKAVEAIQDQSQSWSELAAGGIKVHEIKGDHYTIIREPHVCVLAERLENYFKQMVEK
ncbi:amino acid adenylation domain-containing protein [uncultured Nostoc sp.]|uniref:amino acid adenylation domain-containing protein n=1 Tax=uncultured Nostoc sp. TaxID=340711 RepID=UPI0035CBE55B